jgi:hypothetical protein
MHQNGYQEAPTYTGPPPSGRMILHHFLHFFMHHGGKARSDPFTRLARTTAAAIAAALVSLAVAGAALALLITGKASEASQLAQMRQQIASVQRNGQSAVARAQASNTARIDHLNRELNSAGPLLKYWAQFGSTCEQPFTGTAGPAEFWIPCTAKEPAPAG